MASVLGRVTQTVDGREPQKHTEQGTEPQGPGWALSQASALQGFLYVVTERLRECGDYGKVCVCVGGVKTAPPFKNASPSTVYSGKIDS